MQGMILIPLGTDRDGGKRPIVVPLLVIVCLFVFLLSRVGTKDGQEDFIDQYAISYLGFEWWQPVTHQFLHGGWMHLIWNMIFLAAFGVVLESRLGHLGLLAFYLLGGALAGIAQVWIGYWAEPVSSVIPCVGASGSISALMGAVFALHPRAQVRGLAIPQFVPAQISIRWMIAFAVAVDVVRTILDFTRGGGSGIATLAHLGGLAAGFAGGILLLKTGILKRNDFDALYLFKQWRRRRELRAVMQESGTSGAGGLIAARVAAQGRDQETPAQRTLRATIAAAHRERDIPLAATLYVELLGTAPDATLPAPIQLDVANTLASQGQHQSAVRAYTLYLERFRTSAACDDVRFMKATIEVRRLRDGRAGLATLDAFNGRALSREHAELVSQLRAECGGAKA